ncbi:MAG: DegV family protein [Angelakisella sp.]|jgi:DegV family protein with EDD domain|nr:DegV family protein [Angelakisella sp.]
MLKIITDSAADVPRSEAEEYGIRVMPIPITVDGTTYREGVDFTSEEYYPMLLGASTIPTTAQITPMEFASAFLEEIAAGNRELICVTITARGSGIYNAACLAKNMVLEELPAGEAPVTIEVVDSGAYTYVYGHVVVKAAKAAKEGTPLPEVLELIHRELESHQVYFGLTNLDFAKKSGRITSTAAFVGELLGFRPLLTIHNGETDTIQKVRGDHKLVSAMVEKFQNQASSDGRGFYIVHAQSPELTKDLRKALEKATKRKCLGEYLIGASVTTNAGPTVFGVIVPVDKII